MTFDEVLLAEKDGDVRIGTPSLDGAAVDAEIVGHGKGDKIVVYKMKRRKGYRRKQGHRQGYTEIRIVEIAFPKGKKKAVAKPGDEETAEAPKAKAEKPKAEAATEPAVEETAVEEAPAGDPTAEAAVEEPAVEEGAEAEAETGDAAQEEYDITPAAADRAEEHGIDLSTIEGTGKDGRILKSDVDKAIKDKDA